MDARSLPRTRLIATTLGAYAVGGGLLSFMGWAADGRRLTDWFNTGISIQPNAALAALTAGAAVVCLSLSYRRSAAVLGAVVLLIGATALFENLTGVDLGIDTRLMFHRAWGQGATLSPGRMGLPGSISWSLLGVGLMLPLRGPRARQWAVALGLIAVVLSVLSLVGYLYQADPLYSLPPLTAIALQTSTMIMAVASGLVIAMTDQQPMRILTEASAAGLMIRRALPLVVLLPVILGFLRLKGERAGWYDSGMGAALISLALIVIIGGVLWWGAIGLSRYEAKLKQAEEQLREAARMEALGRLAGGLAHDFNNQLQAVSGLATFIGKDTAVQGRSRQDLEEIQKSVEKIASLVRQLLAFSRKQVLAPDVVELSASVQDSVPLLRQFVGPTIEFQVQPSPTPTWVRVDRAQLQQVLINLTINARHAMPAGGRLTLQVTEERVDARPPWAGVPEGRYACLTVFDTGDGIAAGDLPFIFEPFFTTKGIGEGTGLGLATVHGIVTQSQGHIQAESEPGHGTRFTILLPLTEQPAPHDAPEHSVPAVPKPFRLLVVDDEPMLRTVMQRTLEDEGYQVLVAQDGRQALAMLEGGKIDLVLSDIVMPVMGGAELGEVLATRYPGLPVVWMSGFPKDLTIRDDRIFLLKPIKFDELLTVVAAQTSRRAR